MCTVYVPFNLITVMISVFNDLFCTLFYAVLHVLHFNVGNGTQCSRSMHFMLFVDSAMTSVGVFVCVCLASIYLTQLWPSKQLINASPWQPKF